MRARSTTAALALLFVLGVAACSGARTRVDLHITAIGIGAVADLVIVAVNESGHSSRPIHVTPTSSTNVDQIVQLGFAASVHGNVSIMVTANDASANSLASKTVDVALKAGKIIAAPIMLGATTTLDGGTSMDMDMTTSPPDLIGADLNGALANGQACGAGDTCASGFCVDGTCCDRACDGQCEACSLSANRGVCSPVTGAPVGGRTACASDGPTCGGTCNGVNGAACTYPTVACRAESCSAGVHTAAASCSNGACPLPQDPCALNACDGNACMTVTQIAAGGDWTCTLMSDKTVRCWGDNQYGQLGIGESDTDDKHTPTAVTGLLDVKRIAASAQGFTCAIIQDGSVQCWGQNHRGQLGTGEDPSTVLLHGAPHAVNGLGGAVSQIALGYTHACVIVSTAGNVQCWGRNIEGQIGNSMSSPTVPVIVPTYTCAPGSTGASCTKMSGVAEIGAGAVHSCARMQINTSYCWGTNQEGQLTAGLAVDLTPHPDPVQWGNIDSVHKFYDGVKQNTTCAVNGSSLVCSGDNIFNQFGQSTTNRANTTLTYETANNLSGLSTGEYMSCGLFGDRVSCWGSQNDDGEYGDGTTTSQSAPKPGDITTIASGAVQVSVGNQHACALLTDGTIRCWGKNDHGQVGNDSLASVTSPTTPKW